MDQATANILSEATTDFYQHVSVSFSHTRHAPWEGWKRVLKEVTFACNGSMRVLDVAAGNLRFERYLARQYPHAQIVALDNCPALLDYEGVPDATSFIECDIAEALQSGSELNLASEIPFDLCVCFALVHHLPLNEQRENLLNILVASAKSGGAVALSFWQFEHDKSLLEKARTTTAQGCIDLGVANLDPHDYLLGWQDLKGVYRYCHSFTEDEIDDLVQSLGSRVTEVARFSADGRAGDLNRYIVLRVD